MSDIIVNKHDFMPQQEFKLLMSMTKEKWLTFVRKAFFGHSKPGEAVRWAMNFRRQLQAAVTTYTRFEGTHTHFNDDYDKCIVCMRKWKAVGEMSMKLERLARAVFMRYRKEEIQRAHPNWTKMNVKIEAKRIWENFVKINSF